MSFSRDLIIWCAAVISLFFALAMQVASADIYFRTDNEEIKGGVKSPDFKSWMEASTVSLAASQPPLEIGGSSGLGKVALGPVEVVKLGGPEDADLFKLATNQFPSDLTNVCISFVRAGGNGPVTFQQIKLENAALINMAPVLGGDSEQPVVSLTFDYLKVQILTFKQDPTTGAFSAAGDACYDRVTNTGGCGVTAACGGF